MNEINNQSKCRSDLVGQLISSYSEQRTITVQTEKSTDSSLANLSSLNFSPWDYTLDSNIEIKTEKDLAVDARDFELPNTLEQAGRDMSLNEYVKWLDTVEVGIGCKNAVSYAAIRNESEGYEEQYLSLKLFLAGCNTYYKKDLSQILFPIFVHFYLDLIHKPDLISAQAFYNKFHSEHEETSKGDVLYNLTKISSTTQIILYSNIYTFRKEKCLIKLSQNACMYLIEHLRHGNYALVLQTLNLYFVFKSTEVESSSLSEPVDLSNHDISHEIGLGMLPAGETNLDRKSSRTLKVIHTAARLPTSSKPLISVYSFLNSYDRICCASFSEDKSYLVAGCNNSSINVWKLQSPNIGDDNGRKEEHPANKKKSLLFGHNGAVFSTKFLKKNSPFLISGSQDKSVILWDVVKKKGLVHYKAHTRTVWDVCTSSTNSFFASCSWDQTVRLWNTEYAYPLRLFAGHYDSVNCIEFHPNGNYIASGSTDKTVRLWDVQSGDFVRVFVGHQGTVRSLTFSHDGKYLVSSGDDNIVNVWDLRNGKILRKLNGHQKIIYSMAFSEDDSMLACGGLDSFISVWKRETLINTDAPLILRKETDTIGCYSIRTGVIYNLSFSYGHVLYGAALNGKR